jgi:coenzyme F420 hydrogenase subunit beta
MTFSDLQAAVLDHDLCTRCGACVAVCPAKVIDMADDDFLPLFATDPAAAGHVCGTCSLCLDVCPGRETGVNTSEVRRFGRAREAAERWTGISRGVFEVVSCDEGVLEHASAGGAVTSLLIAALRGGVIDAALVVEQDAEHPWRSRATLTDSEATIIRSAAAKYSFAPNLPLIADAPFRRIGVVGLPCQIEAINKMCNLDQAPEAARSIALTIELACASATLPAGTRHVIEERLGVDVDEVSSLRYRGGDYPGTFHVRTRDGADHRYPFFEMVKDFTRFKTFRCEACPDWWSGLADISVADGDPNIFATSRRGITGRPRSTVVVRTKLGERLLNEAGDQGLVKAVTSTFDAAQSLGLQRKRNRYNRIAQSATRLIPSAPAVDTPTGPWKRDEDVIAEMSEQRSTAG